MSNEAGGGIDRDIPIENPPVVENKEHFKVEAQKPSGRVKKHITNRFKPPESLRHSTENGDRELLTEGQHETVKVAFSVKLLQRFIDDAEGQLPWLRSKDGVRSDLVDKENDKRLVALHMGGLLANYRSMMNPENESLRRAKLDWERGDYLEHRVETMLPELSEEKEKLLKEAESWELDDLRKELKTAHKFAAKLPPEQRSILFEQTNITPQKVKEELEKWGITVGANAISFGAYEGIATLAGLGIASMRLQEHVDSATHMWWFLAGSYIPWAAGMGVNLKANWRALNEAGVSTSIPSKALFEFAKKRGWNEKAQKIAAAVGYVGKEVAMELPHYGLGFGADAAFTSIDDKDSLSYLAGANIGAAGYEFMTAFVTNKILNRRKNSDHRNKEMPS